VRELRSNSLYLGIIDTLKAASAPVDASIQPIETLGMKSDSSASPSIIPRHHRNLGWCIFAFRRCWKGLVRNQELFACELFIALDKILHALSGPAAVALRWNAFARKPVGYFR
jgi:hypothetical protein